MLRIIRSKQNLKDENSTRYLKKIINEAINNYLDVTILEAQDQFELNNFLIDKNTPTIVLEPCEFKYDVNSFNNLDKHLTATAIFNIIKDVKKEKEELNVLILNRSIQIGIPLTGMLLKEKYSIITVGKKNWLDFKDILEYVDVIVAATGSNLSHLENYILPRHTIIDVSDDFKDTKIKPEYDMKAVGQKVTNLLIKNAYEDANNDIGEKGSWVKWK